MKTHHLFALTIVTVAVASGCGNRYEMGGEGQPCDSCDPGGDGFFSLYGVTGCCDDGLVCKTFADYSDICQRLDGPSSAMCTPGEQSEPGMKENPCPTNNPACSSAMGKMAVTTCGPDGVWLALKPMGVCDCLPIGCGNGVMDPGEACEPKLALPATATCMAIGNGPVAVFCNPLTCTLSCASLQ